MFPRLFGDAGAEKMFGDLMAFTDEWLPDLVVSEAAEALEDLAGKGTH